MSNRTHMTESDRATILRGIINRKSFVDIGKEIGKHPSTITREVMKHRVPVRSGFKWHAFNDCRLRMRCPEMGACDDRTCRRSRCFGCTKYCCSDKCPHYEKEVCPRLQGVPYVCDGCNDRSKCTLEKMEYSPAFAQKQYKDLLSDSRSGHRATEEEIEQMNRVIHSGSNRGQSLNHIYSYAGEGMPYSQRTAYNLVNDGCLPDVIRLDLPRAVTYKKRVNRNKAKEPADQAYLQGRKLADYLSYIDEHPDVSVVQMDCVEGKKHGNGRVLMTLHFIISTLQVAYILDHKSMDSVVECHRKLRMKIGNEMYSRLFGVILTDRGSEFKSPERLEIAENGEIVTRVFYCDPLRSDQKAECERNHAEIRRVFLKGTDLRCNQDKVDIMMDNVNGNARPQYQNKPAYDMFVLFYGTEAAEALGLSRIEPSEVTLNPSLLD